MKYDLHVHSRYSDGDLSVEELCCLSQKKGINGFALTDHDTIDGWREIPKLQQKYNLTIVPSVEISTEYENRDVHILVYGLTEDMPNITALLARLRKSRIRRIEAFVHNLNRIGFAITVEDVYAVAGQASPGRPHIAKVVVEKGYAKNVAEVFKKYIGRGCSAYAEREKLTPCQCLEIIEADKGLAVLAHPGLDNNFQLLKKLKAAGLWGLEVFHSSHTNSQEIKFKALAQEYNLRITGGSDFHRLDDNDSSILGSKFIETDDITDLFR